MSAAISSHWWAAKSLLTERARDVRKIKGNVDTDAHVQLPTSRDKEDGARHGEAVALESGVDGGGSRCLHLLHPAWP